MLAIAQQLDLAALLRRYRSVLPWLAFALGNCAAMFVLPDWVLAVPLVAWFLAMAWQARRRAEALCVVEARAEERRSLLERQERFIHDVSHELRSPVAIAMGHLEIARARGMRAGEIDVALDELARINATIDRLLVLAAADQPDFLRFRKLELEPFLEDVFFRWSEVAPRAWRLGPLISGEVLADPDRLRTALDALLENAVKYTCEANAIELRARVDDLGRTLIEVEDEGCGIAEAALEQIFDRFGRADTARTCSAGGVGLGLAIVDAIAKRHGGRCTAESAPGGSVFALVLPAAPASDGSSVVPLLGPAPLAGAAPLARGRRSSWMPAFPRPRLRLAWRPPLER